MIDVAIGTPDSAISEVPITDLTSDVGECWADHDAKLLLNSDIRDGVVVESRLVIRD
jgi:hypothetical protein